MQDNRVVLKNVSGQTLFTTTPMTQLRKPHMKIFTNNRVPMARQNIQMNAATLGFDKSMGYIQSQMNTGTNSEVTMPFMPMTSPRMETTLRMVSDQVTKRAMQMKQSQQPVQKVASTATKRALMAPSYGKVKSDIVEQLVDHHRGRYASNNPYAFLSKQAEPDLTFAADRQIAFAMSQAPTIESTGEAKVIEEYMDDVITDYATAKSEVRQSFLGRMVGPAFVAGAVAAAATLAPFPVGAYDTIPNVWDSVDPSLEFANHPGLEFSMVGMYFASFIRNATICGVLVASPAIYRYYEQQTEALTEEETQVPLVQESA